MRVELLTRWAPSVTSHLGDRGEPFSQNSFRGLARTVEHCRLESVRGLYGRTPSNGYSPNSVLRRTLDDPSCSSDLERCAKAIGDFGGTEVGSERRSQRLAGDHQPG